MNRRILANFIIAFLLFVVLYLPIFPDMFRIWIESSDDSHGLLVPFISLFLVLKERKRINWDEAQTSNVGLAVLIVSLILYIVGYAGGVEVLPRLTMVSTFIGLVIYNFGLGIFRSFAFPLVFLFFMVPAPVSVVGLVSFPLQMIATKLSAYIISSLSIPVVREGNMLYFADTSLEVAEACSGIRSLISYLMLGFLFAYLMNESVRRRAILVLSTVPLAFSANLFRVTGTGILAHFFGGRIARGFLHEFSGLAIFALGFIMLLVLSYILEHVHKGNSEKVRTF